VRVAAALLFAVGLFFLWQIYIGNSSERLPQNKITNNRVTPDSVTKDTSTKPLITNQPKEQKPASDDSAKANTPDQNQRKATPVPQQEFEQYIAMRSRFEDIGVRLQYTIGKVETRTIVNNDSSQKITIPLTVQTPVMVTWQPLKKSIQFTIMAKAPLPDTTQMFIQIENHEREPIKTIALQKIAPQQWQCVWLATQPGLYYWQFKRSKTDDPQPTGKIYVGDKMLIEKLYLKFPGLGGF